VKSCKTGKCSKSINHGKLSAPAARRPSNIGGASRNCRRRRGQNTAMVCINCE